MIVMSGQRTLRMFRLILMAFVTVLWCEPLSADAPLRLQVSDESGQPVPCRVHLRDEAGRAVQSLGLTDRLDHLSIDGDENVTLPPGNYVYGIERSPEWERVEGEVRLRDGQDATIAVTLRRLVDLAARGWYSGDMHIHRPPEQIVQLMRSSDLHIGPVITWWNNRNLWSDRPLPQQPLVQFDAIRFYHLVAGEDEREGGALLYFGFGAPIDITGASREVPSPMEFVKQARESNPDTWIDIEKPFWWDVPVWLALADPDSIGLANNHMCRDRMLENEAWGRPRDAVRFPAPRGNGYWTQEIYYHIQSSGFRLPPSAGSASGVLPNPVGYNRVYVHVDGDLTWDKWWEGLRAGCSFVSNGPVLLCQADSHLPGHVFQFESERTIRINVELTTQDRVTKLEVVQNGDVVQTIPCDDRLTQTVSAFLPVSGSGWFLVRAIADNPRTFRFASTAPFYVEVGEQPRRISRRSVQFFLDWIRERRERVRGALAGTDQRAEVLSYHDAALSFWQKRLESATDD